MVKFTRAEIFGDEQSHESIVTVSRKSQETFQESLIKVPYRSMNENEKLILRVMQSAIAPLNRAKIARLIGRKKSPGINKLIEQLVESGVLCKYVVKRPNGVDMYLYERSDGSLNITGIYHE